LAVIFFAGVIEQKATAVPLVSNLADLWTEGGIGDIHGLFPGGTPYGSDTARFETGTGGNFALNSVMLEFEVSRGAPVGEWNNVDVQLYQGSLLLGNLGNPVIDPTPTQWPQSSSAGGAYTTFIDFSPFVNITLAPPYAIFLGDKSAR